MKANELKQKFSASMEKLIDLIESDEINDEVNAFWRTMSHFHNYSFRNQVLISIQKPDASRVAGYKTWQKMKRQVRKGETGIRILAPLRYHKEGTEYSEDDPRAFGMAFRGVSVFDVTQTEGDDLPDITRIDGSEHGAILDRMTKFAEDNKITVEYGETGNAKGYAIPDQKTIRLSDKIDKNAAVGTLAHELAHCMIDQSDEPYKIGEYEAELSAFLVCQKFGIERKAAHYLKAWGAERKDLETALNAVSNFTKKLIDGVAA